MAAPTLYSTMTPNSTLKRHEFPRGAPYPGFFFITGAHRSGTSWLTWMLNTHPEIFASMEAYFLGTGKGVTAWLDQARYLEWARGSGHLNGWTKDINDSDLIRSARRCMVEGFMRAHWRPGITMLGDKTPVQYLVHAQTVKDLFPDAVVMCCERDGRDTTVSLALHQLAHNHIGAFEDEAAFKVRHDYWIKGVGDPVSLLTPKTLETYSNEWQWCIEKSQAAAAILGDRFVVVRYDHMLDDASGILKQLFGKLGVADDEATISACVEKNRFEALTGRRRGEGLATEFVRKGISGDWRNYFTERDKEQFKASASGRHLIERGYAADNSW